MLESAYLTYVYTGRYPMSSALITAAMHWVHTGYASPEVSDMLADIDANPDMKHTIRRYAVIREIIAHNA